MGIVIACGFGINHVLDIKGSNILNMIPVDICVKGMIIASWKVWKENFIKSEKIEVFNAASIKFVSYESMGDGENAIKKYPSKNCIGPVSVTFTTCRFYSTILKIFRHYIPAMIIDGLLFATGNEPK
jgi:alcohol-forming fatty acyl-CoA reductase